MSLTIELERNWIEDKIASFEISVLQQDLDAVIKQFLSFKNEYEVLGYRNLRIHIINKLDNIVGFSIIGKRQETDEELIIRQAHENKIKQAEIERDAHKIKLEKTVLKRLLEKHGIPEDFKIIKNLEQR